MCLAPFLLFIPAVAGDSAIAGVHDEIIGDPNVFSDLSVAGVPAVVRVSLVEPVAVVAYTRT